MFTAPVPLHFLSHFAWPVHLVPLDSIVNVHVHVLLPNLTFSFLNTSFALSVGSSLVVAGMLGDTNAIKKSGTH